MSKPSGEFDLTQGLFAGGGEMARRMLALDWSRTTLGPPHQWPQSLKTAVRIMLTSRFAMWMAWGPDLTFFCNDAYLPTLGVKGSWALGARSDVVWAEIWKDIGPRISQVLSEGHATWDEGLLLFLERSGYTEETYHTFSYSPLADDTGAVTGMLCVVTEESERVVGERRLRVLGSLSSRLNGARTTDEVFRALHAGLQDEPQDLPFALAYLPAQERDTAELRCALRFGVGADHALAPGVIGPQGESGQQGPAPWVVAPVLSGAVPAQLQDLQGWPDVPRGPWDRPPLRSLTLPIIQPGMTLPAGVLIVGLNPYRPLDDAYRSFLDLCVTQLASALTSVTAYEQERQRAEVLAQLDRAKTAFFANASHELRTPLTLMLGPLEDLLTGEQGELSAQQQQTLSMAHRNSLRLLRLVNSLLDFSRLEAGRAQARFVPTDFVALNADLTSSFRSAMNRAGLAFRVELESLPAPVYVDLDLWEKVLLNLLSNAFKFTLQGEVAVTLRAEDRHVVLTVQDTGVGVPAAEVERLFERFHRVEGQRGRSFEGSGIGLALVREIVLLHGGTIEASSEEGRGTTFTLRLPFGSAHLPPDRVAAPTGEQPSTQGALPFVEEALRWLPSAPAPLADPEPDGPAQPTERRQVLIVDDNADLREYLQRLLEPHHDVQVARDGLEALEAIRGRLPDLMVTDVMMPRLDGLGLLAAVRESPATRDLPVIMLSARAGEEARVQGLQSGADDYLVKPFSARELLAKVNANLKLSQLRREALEREQAYSAELEARVEARTRELREALDHSERQTLELNTVLASMPDAVYVGDLSGIQRANRPALDIVGFGSMEELRRSVIDLSVQLQNRDLETGAPLPPEQTPFVRALRGEAVRQDVRLRHMRTGEDRVVRVAAAPLRRDGQVFGAVAVVSDITDQVALQGDILRANQELSRSNAELERFAYIASHDLQEPIRTVGSYAGLLAHRYGDRLDERAEMYLQTVQKGAERMQTLVNDLLVFSRLNGERPLPSPVPLREVVQEALARLEAARVEADAQVELGELPVVLGAASRLAQLFQNLIGNALKFRAPDRAPLVSVRAEREGAFWRVSVQDNGIGIAPEYHQRIFEMFQRLHIRDQFEGSGLGLAICEKIVAQHGGRLWVTSEPGQGSAFHLTLPAVSDDGSG
ncbi:ATP-binding protein [Deinococcus sp. 6GRE01]|uniref:ATP-binding protein n=1 Tax=Deinococcus sp. 6GRE01 TaxID=2745873 RepID=UPI001E5CF97F|nr:ATP-binding protein [Deinococcus sp. 6GRE01]MCD0157877.1 response regulator [Deinococcus sp. 6GRE01]